jgi:hypothetical protein
MISFMGLLLVFNLFFDTNTNLKKVSCHHNLNDIFERNSDLYKLNLIHRVASFLHFIFHKHIG